MRILLLFLLVIPVLSFAQLKEFEVREMSRPDVAVVQANTEFPDDALVLVYSSLQGLQFRSSMGALDKQTYNNRAGRYEILVKPVKQMMFVAKPGFMELKISTINPNPKDVLYFRVMNKPPDMSGNEFKSPEVDRLLALKRLFDAAVITEDEYKSASEELKKYVLGKSQKSNPEVSIQKHQGIGPNLVSNNPYKRREADRNHTRIPRDMPNGVDRTRNKVAAPLRQARKPNRFTYKRGAQRFGNVGQDD